MNDDELVTRVKAGDLDAFETIMDRHLRRIRAFIALQAPVSDLIDEVAHETFIFAYRNIETFTSGQTLYPWLRAIASNLLRSHQQRWSREQVQQARYVHQRIRASSGKSRISLREEMWNAWKSVSPTCLVRRASWLN